MNASELIARLRSLLGISMPMPVPGGGETSLRHSRLAAIAREDLSLARLAEAHYDAVAILAEAGRVPVANAIYGVWASDLPDAPLEFHLGAHTISGRKMFCTGAQLIDRALVTAGAGPFLFEIDLEQQAEFISYDDSSWQTDTFGETQTFTACFDSLPVMAAGLIGDRGWYLNRSGFWHGACGPAACWAGGAIALVDYARRQTRADPHTLAHLGAMHATAWALEGYLKVAGDEIDDDPHNLDRARLRALTLRHVMEAGSTEILRRLPRAFGPRPLAMDRSLSRRYHELDLYLRQSHAERDLEAVGRLVRQLCSSDE
jgi:alkylation response protein AidB-like acyl-CoA dehydrogenase